MTNQTLTFGSKPQKPNMMAEVVSRVPLDHILLETDSPYLSPVPLRGRRNEPSHIPIIAQKVADLRGISVDEVGRATSSAARRLFGINPGLQTIERVP